MTGIAVCAPKERKPDDVRLDTEMLCEAQRSRGYLEEVQSFSSAFDRLQIPP